MPQSPLRCLLKIPLKKSFHQLIAQWAIRKIISLNTQLCGITWTSLGATWRLSLILIYWTEATTNCRHQISQGQYQSLAIKMWFYRLSSLLKSDIPDATVTNEKHNSTGVIFKCELKYIILTWWKPHILYLQNWLCVQGSCYLFIYCFTLISCQKGA